MGVVVAVGLAACELDDDGGPGLPAIEAVEPFFPVDTDGNEALPCGGFGFRPENGDFHRAFNEKLNELRSDGTTEEIVTSYDAFVPADVEKANALSARDVAPDANEIAETGGTLLDELRRSGTIEIGIANEMPFGFLGDDGEPTGIGPDVASAVLRELGIEGAEATVVPFDRLIDELHAGRFDVVAAGMYITDEAAEQILFSDPTYCTSEGLAVAAGNPHGIEDYQSFVADSDLTLAVLADSVEAGYARDAGIPADQLMVFDHVDAMYRALDAGDVDAVGGSAATIARQVGSRS